MCGQETLEPFNRAPFGPENMRICRLCLQYRSELNFPFT